MTTHAVVVLGEATDDRMAWFKMKTKKGRLVILLLAMTTAMTLLLLHMLRDEHNLKVVIKDNNDISSNVPVFTSWTSLRHPIYNFSVLSTESKLLENIHLHEIQYLTLNDNNVNQFVFVTAADALYVPMANRAIATVQRFFPGRKIIFYDLNIKEGHSPVKNLCNVEYRMFPFAKYPNHVTRLHTYAWKPLIVLDVLRDHPGVLWFDSSARFLSNNTEPVFHKVLSTDGLLLFNYAGHNTYSVTHPRTFHYLGADQQRLQAVMQYDANVMMLYRTKSAFDDVIKWWVMCALVDDCIAPTSSLTCKAGFQKLPAQYAGCHRFDQTAINILLANKFDYNSSRYAKHYDNFEEIRRFNTEGEPAQIC